MQRKVGEHRWTPHHLFGFTRRCCSEEQAFGGAAMSLPVDLSCLQDGGGGVDREAALATLEKQLICPICLELFNKPVVILPCEHNLCRKCANELYQPSLFQARTTMLVSSGRFRCPTCRHEVVLDRHGVYGLQRNLLVENIIDAYKQEVSNNSAPSPVPPAPATPSSQLTCSDHEGEKVNIYCLTCQVPTCSLCKVFGAHQSCQVAPLTDIYQLQKDELSEEIDSLVAVNGKVQALIDELEQTCRNIEENGKTEKRSVCDTFDRMFSILEERRKMMTEQISSEQEEKTKHAQVLMRCYGENVEDNNKLIERAVSSMEEPDMAAFVQNSRELITKVLSATSSCPTETLKPGYENMSHYRFNFSRQERAAKSIDFNKVVEEVPEELETSPDPEEEPNTQTTEPNCLQETCAQNLESAEEPVKDLIPALISPEVEMLQRETPTPDLISSAPLLRDSVESAGTVLQLDTDDPDVYDGGSVILKNKEEKDEAERCSGSGSVKEGHFCEGMSTQQCEGEGTESDGGDVTTHREKEEKQDAQDEEEEMQIEDRVDTTFYPSNVRPAVSAPDPEPVMCSTQAAAGSLLDAQTEDVVQPVNDLQVQLQPPWSQSEIQIEDQDRTYPTQSPPEPLLVPHLELQQLPLSTQLHSKPYFPVSRPSLHSENHPQPELPVCESQSQPQNVHLESQGSGFTAGQAAPIKEDNEEEEDMQGWVCLPGTVDTSFGLVEHRFDFGDGSLGHNSDSDTPLSTQADETSSDKDSSEPNDGASEDAEEKTEPEEDSSGHSEAETMEEDNIQPDESEELEKDIVAAREDSWNARDQEVESKNNSTQGDGDWGFEAVGSGFSEKKEEHRNDEERSQDFDGKTGGSDAEAEEKITSGVSLQVSAVWFDLARRNLALFTHLLMWLHVVVFSSLFVFAVSLLQHCCNCFAFFSSRSVFSCWNEMKNKKNKANVVHCHFVILPITKCLITHTCFHSSSIRSVSSSFPSNPFSIFLTQNQFSILSSVLFPVSPYLPSPSSPCVSSIPPSFSRLSLCSSTCWPSWSSFRGCGLTSAVSFVRNTSRKHIHPHCCTAQSETESRSPAQISPPVSSSCSTSCSEAPRRPSFCFSWLNPLQKKKQ
ncbi:hypothetical protein Q5P01_008249 [Channa striata]|uniref:RING-type E3 ubiquitin transferase n=1 Tax=Channa striata TaxID=64152 RepID=A0AA88N6C1_CHASR|nr:hypothetical protein Q5P01_008249 [Channa striata]